jgi:hypothetical protein
MKKQQIVAFYITLCVLIAARRDREGERKYSVGRELIYEAGARFEIRDSVKHSGLAPDNASCLCLRDI